MHTTCKHTYTHIYAHHITIYTYIHMNMYMHAPYHTRCITYTHNIHKLYTNTKNTYHTHIYTAHIIL